MIKKLLVVLFVFHSSCLFAQTIKTDVLVIGGTASGVAASVQSARSKIKTVLIAGDIRITAATSQKLWVDPLMNSSSGTWAEFRKNVLEFYKPSATKDTSNREQLFFEKDAGEAILKKMTDSVKNLSVYLNARFESVKKDGEGWEVRITQNSKTLDVKAKVIVDATEDGIVVKTAAAKFNGAIDLYNQNNTTALYRTSIASGEFLPQDNYPPETYWYVPLTSVLARDADNLLVTEKLLPEHRNANHMTGTDYLPAQLQIGQGVGAAAAYCVFFKTTTKHLKTRTIQGELLDFKAFLSPMSDIEATDPDWRPIQQVCTTGLLKCAWENGQFAFSPDAPVTTAEIKPVLTEIYTRAFLWFNKEKPGEKFTLENTLSFISDYSLTDPLVLKSAVQKDWKTRYNFEKDFDLKRQINRREFAVLANRYLNPFARTVDLNGRLVN